MFGDLGRSWFNFKDLGSKGKILSGSWGILFYGFGLINELFSGIKGAQTPPPPWGASIFLLTVTRRYFFRGSFMLFLSCVCYAFVHVCLLLPCGHLLGKGWTLGSRFRYLIVSLLLSHWYPVSGVVLDCIDSWILPSFLHHCFRGKSAHPWIFHQYFAAFPRTSLGIGINSS